MAAYNIDFVLAQSTGQALAELRKQQFDAIISDMGRPPDSRAGYTLLEAVRGSGDQTPYFIYAGSRDPCSCARSAQPRCSGHHEYGRRTAPNVAGGSERMRPPIRMAMTNTAVSHLLMKKGCRAHAVLKGTRVRSSKRVDGRNDSWGFELLCTSQILRRASKEKRQNRKYSSTETHILITPPVSYLIYLRASRPLRGYLNVTGHPHYRTVCPPIPLILENCEPHRQLEKFDNRPRRGVSYFRINQLRSRFDRQGRYGSGANLD